MMVRKWSDTEYSCKCNKIDKEQIIKKFVGLIILCNLNLNVKMYNYGAKK